MCEVPSVSSDFWEARHVLDQIAAACAHPASHSPWPADAGLRIHVTKSSDRHELWVTRRSFSNAREMRESSPFSVLAEPVAYGHLQLRFLRLVCQLLNLGVSLNEVRSWLDDLSAVSFVRPAPLPDGLRVDEVRLAECDPELLWVAFSTVGMDPHSNDKLCGVIWEQDLYCAACELAV